MDYAFQDIICKISAIYQDDRTIFSKYRNAHVLHLRKILKRCMKYKISLNPNKFVFGVDKGKLLGHIVSKGVKVDLAKIEGIQHVPLPLNKKAIQSFFGKINFIRRFIPFFAEIVKPVIVQVVGWEKPDPTTEQVLQLGNPTPNVTLM
jgi:hypothetical protein